MGAPTNLPATPPLWVGYSNAQKTDSTIITAPPEPRSSISNSIMNFLGKLNCEESAQVEYWNCNKALIGPTQCFDEEDSALENCLKKVDAQYPR